MLLKRGSVDKRRRRPKRRPGFEDSASKAGDRQQLPKDETREATADNDDVYVRQRHGGILALPSPLRGDGDRRLGRLSPRGRCRTWPRRFVRR